MDEHEQSRVDISLNSVKLGMEQQPIDTLRQSLQICHVREPFVELEIGRSMQGEGILQEGKF